MWINHAVTIKWLWYTLNRTTTFVYVNRIRTFKVRMCVPINEIESGIWDEIELLTSPRVIEWQLCVVKLNEFLFKLNEIHFKRNDMKWNWRLKAWKWTMRAESWQKSRELERLFMILNAILMKLGGETYIKLVSLEGAQNFVYLLGIIIPRFPLLSK